MFSISWTLIAPQDLAEWKAAFMLVLGGMFGWVVSPLIWWAWGPMRWPAYLLAMAAQESGYDPGAQGAAGELGILQFSPSSTWVASIAPAVGGEKDWRLSPFWSGYYAARYYQAQAWSAPMLIAVWLIPFIGPAAARFTWTHSLEQYGVTGVLQECWPVVYDMSTETSGERAFRLAYPLWWSIFHLPLVALAIGVAAAKEGR